MTVLDFSGCAVVKEFTYQCRRYRRLGFDSLVGRSPGEGNRHSSILAWRIPWTVRSLAEYSPWGRKESDMTEQLSVHDSAHYERPKIVPLWEVMGRRGVWAVICVQNE